MKKMNRLTALLGAVVLSAAMLAQGVSAAIGDIAVTTPGVDVAPVQDGVIADGEYGGADPLVLDGSGANTEGTWAGTAWRTEKFTIYTAWDAANFYMGLKVSGDDTNNQGTVPAVGANTCPFGQCDSIQIGFNPGAIVTGQHPVLYCIGLGEGDTYVHADAYHSTKDGEQSLEYCGKFSNYCTKYSATGDNYVFEIAIPWTEICLEGAGRSGEGANVFDMTGELDLIGPGYELPFFFVYTDKDENGNNVYIRTDATTGAQWVAEEMGSIGLNLGEMPAPETVAEAVDAGVAPQTFDMGAIAAVAAVVSAAGYALSKKR